MQRENENLLISDLVTMEDNEVNRSIKKRKINKSNLTGLTSDKKAILRKLRGSASIPIDFNKIREEQKYGENWFYFNSSHIDFKLDAMIIL